MAVCFWGGPPVTVDRHDTDRPQTPEEKIARPRDAVCLVNARGAEGYTSVTPPLAVGNEVESPQNPHERAGARLGSRGAVTSTAR
jgi:hypothetical protein